MDPNHPMGHVVLKLFGDSVDPTRSLCPKLGPWPYQPPPRYPQIL